MKKFVAHCFVWLLSLHISILARGFSIGGDFLSIDSFLMEDSRFALEVAIPVDDYELVFPIRYGRDENNYLKYAETGVLVAIHPIENLDFFVEASFLKVGWIWGLYQPEDPLVLSSEGSLGWTFRWKRLVLKPKLTVRNPYLTESDKVELIKRISQFRDIHISLIGEYAF